MVSFVSDVVRINSTCAGVTSNASERAPLCPAGPRSPLSETPDRLIIKHSQSVSGLPIRMGEPHLETDRKRRFSW